jgi:nucleoside-diphosphate-sugar epimerase
MNSKLIAFAAGVGDKLHLPLNSERLKKLTESYVVSNSKLKKALGIEKMPVSAEEGMRETLSSLRATNGSAAI